MNQLLTSLIKNVTKKVNKLNQNQNFAQFLTLIQFYLSLFFIIKRKSTFYSFL